jgi:hypothetical protein
VAFFRALLQGRVFEGRSVPGLPASISPPEVGHNHAKVKRSVSEKKKVRGVKAAVALREL